MLIYENIFLTSSPNGTVLPITTITASVINPAKIANKIHSTFSLYGLGVLILSEVPERIFFAIVY